MIENDSKGKGHIGRFATVVTFVAVTAVAAIIGAWVVFFAGPKESAKSASLNIELHRYMGDYSAALLPFTGKQGTLTTYWEITISNSGSTTDTIVQREVLAYSPRFGVHSYSGIDQGNYDTKLNPLELPLSIEAGRAIRFFIKTRTMVADTPYKIIKEEFKGDTVRSVEEIHRFLYRKGLDIYGLRVDAIGEGGFSFPDAKQAPGLIVSFTTVGGKAIQGEASWYPSP